MEVTLPKMGESVNEATITKWLVEEGAQVEEDDPILEIATDKVDSEVPAPADGVLQKQMCSEGDVVKVGEVIAVLQAEGEEVAETAEKQETQQTAAAGTSSQDTSGASEETAQAAVAEPVPEQTEGIPSGNGVVEIPRKGPSGKFYSPLVRNIARTEEVSLEELEQIQGSGREGRVTKEDLLAYLSGRSFQPAAQQPVAKPAASRASAASPAPSEEPSAPDIPVGANDEVVQMDRYRKLIAEHMVMSKRTSPHVTSFVEADMTNIVQWRNRIKKEFQQREGEKITFTPIFIEAIIKALKEFPMVNVSVSGDKIIKRGDINIGMATAQSNGNLIVPVIKNADQLNLVGLTKAVNDLASRARENKLKPDETQGGTYTISNVGSFGNLMGTPVINQPQVAVMAVGSIEKRPSVVETPQGDTLGIRHKMFLSHSYDHRVVDGALGGMFVRKVGDLLEQFDPKREL